MNDETDRGKAIATVVIWVAMAAISLFAVANSYSMGELAVILVGVLPLLLALIATLVIWVAAPIMVNRGLRAGLPYYDGEKAKREAGSDRLAILLEMMDDDEREAFKQMLKQKTMRDMRLSQDAELPFNADLWDEHLQDQHQR